MNEISYVLRSEDIRDRLIKVIGRVPIVMDGKPYQVTISRYQPQRSVQQNRRYWALVGKIAHGMAEYSDGEYFHPETWHAWLVTRFLGVNPGPEETTFPKSTSKLGVQEFSDYMTEVEAWAAENGIFLEL